MKKIYSFAFLFLTLLCRSYANPIDEATARRVGQSFLVAQAGPQLAGQLLTLAYRADAARSASATQAPTAFFYVFNTADAHGFVLVAGDDDVVPVLGYSNQSGFNPANIPENMAKWLEGYRQEIRAVQANHLAGSADIKAAWRSLQSGGTVARRGTTAVAPLVQTRWNQSPYYNALCPYDNAGVGRSVSGCVATAMTQVMKYWSYPTTGAGFHSYNSTNFGTLSANFGATTYQWSSMPNTVSSANTAVATLTYQVGVSVDMGYSVSSSNAYVISAASSGTHCAEYALKTYFGYRPTMQGIQRSNYTAATWLTTLKNELNASRPIIYAGFGTGGGHCFVTDGYDTNDFLHINWGWGGQSDGYYIVSGLSPGSLGAGGGAGGFNSNQQAIIGIQPPATVPTQTTSMSLNNTVAPSASTLGYGQAFNVSTNMVNTGTAAFAGDYCAAVFDINNALVDYVETKTSQSLPAGFTYNSNLSFATTGLFSMLPGTYRIGIFYRPAGGNWLLVADRNGFTNLPQVTVTNTNAVRLNSAITATPGTFTQGQAASVNLNILNAGTTAFTGQYQVGLYNLDGSYVQTIGTYSETAGLPSNFTYQAPYLTFNTAAVTAAPGTYLLAVQHKATSASSWQLTGTGNFQNPVRVTVQTPATQPDAYELNNTVAQATVLPVSFASNSATRNTVGSNCHVTTDVDYYSVALPAGYSYSVTARLHDSYNSGNSQSYSLDALFSYSTDGGTTWSTTYDDVMPNSVLLPNGGNLLVKVAPYFAGNIGTYLFDMSLTRGTVSATAPAALARQVGVYPNPAREVMNVDLRTLTGSVSAVRLLTSTGQLAYETTSVAAGTILSVPVGGLPAGLYLAQIHTSQGVITKKISVTQ